MVSQKRGRKSANKSRAAEIRARLAAWKQSPEPRISLRALAAEIGTSHQLLSFYLRRWDKWQEREYRRQAKAIRDRADAENRSMSESEMERELAYRQAANRCMWDSVFGEVWRHLEVDARRGKLHPKIADYLARLNDPRAQKILQMSQKAGPKKGKRLDAVIKELDQTTDSEKALHLIRQLTPKERKEFRALQETRRRTRQGGRT